MEINTCKVVKAKKRKTREGYRSLAEAYNRLHGREDNKFISVSLDDGLDVVCLYCSSYDRYLDWKAKKVTHSELVGKIKKKPIKRPRRKNQEIITMWENNNHNQGIVRYCMSKQIYYTQIS